MISRLRVCNFRTSPNRITLAQYRGKPVVVNFFASWCTSCDFELPGYHRVSQALESKVTFVGVNALDHGDGLAMARRFHIDNWPLARDIGGSDRSGLHDALGGQGMPLTAFYDAQGHLVDRAFGALPEDTLRAKLHQLFDVTV